MDYKYDSGSEDGDKYVKEEYSIGLNPCGEISLGNYENCFIKTHEEIIIENRDKVIDDIINEEIILKMDDYSHQEETRESRDKIINKILDNKNE